MQENFSKIDQIADELANEIGRLCGEMEGQLDEIVDKGVVGMTEAICSGLDSLAGLGGLSSAEGSFTFQTLPGNLAELQALPEADLSSPFRTAALTVLALCVYVDNEAAGVEMLNWLRGPRPLTGRDLAFLKDRFRGGAKHYLPFSYFVGATPENNYTPPQPYKIVINSTHNSALEKGYMKLFIPCGGADNPRPIKMRHKPSTNQWFLWEQYLLTDIRPCMVDDPWA